MQFRLSTLFLLFVVLWSSLAVFGSVFGVVAFAFFVVLAVGIARSWPFVFGLLILPVLLAFSLPAINTASEAARRIGCNNQMRQIALALHDYHRANGCFPPAYIADKNGKPMHSWRVLILPYFGNDDLYKQYNFNEPWDGPNNKKLLAAYPGYIVCPSDGALYSSATACTSYVAVVGRNAALPGAQSRKLAELKPPDQTILLVEVTGANIPWSEPRDLDLDALRASPQKALTVSSKHPSGSDFFHYTPTAGANVALADGSVRFLSGKLLDSGKLPDLLAVGGFLEEYVDGTWATRHQRIHWPNCIALAIWFFSVSLLIFRAAQSRKALAASRADARAGEGTIGEPGQTPMTPEQ
jgi:hypothetical protein